MKCSMASICEKYGVVKCMIAISFSVERTGVRKRQREGTLGRTVRYDKEAFDKRLAWQRLEDNTIHFSLRKAPIYEAKPARSALSVPCSLSGLVELA